MSHHLLPIFIYMAVFIEVGRVTHSILGQFTMGSTIYIPSICPNVFSPLNDQTYTLPPVHSVTHQTIYVGLISGQSIHPSGIH